MSNEDKIRVLRTEISILKIELNSNYITNPLVIYEMISKKRKEILKLKASI